MRIGELAERTGVSTRTLRFYADEGLFGKLPRSAKAYRVFPPSAVEAVRFLQLTQACGFSLGEISQLLAIRPDQPGACSRVSGLLDQKLDQVEQKLQEILAVKAHLLELKHVCDTAIGTGPCPVVPRKGE